MTFLRKRSYEPELLDGDKIPQEALFQNLKEIEFVNKHLGGHQITIDGLRHLMRDKNKTYHIIDIGCGAGDNLKMIHQWAIKNGFSLRLYGLDIKQDAIIYAQNNTRGIEITYITDSYENLHRYHHGFDIALCCLFCHHFPEPGLKKLFDELDKTCKVGYLINDLHRHWLAYYFIKFAGMLFSKSYLFKNDAPLSVARGFKQTEILPLFSNRQNISVHWKWAFRWLIVKQLH